MLGITLRGTAIWYRNGIEKGLVWSLAKGSTCVTLVEDSLES